jgi:hypothetical protein
MFELSKEKKEKKEKIKRKYLILKYLHLIKKRLPH